MPGDDLKKTASDAADSVKQAAADAADKLNTAKEQARDYADRGMEYASDYWAARRVRAARTMDGDGWGFYGWLCDGSAAAERIAGLIVLLVPIMAEERAMAAISSIGMSAISSLPANQPPHHAASSGQGFASQLCGFT